MPGMANLARATHEGWGGCLIIIRAGKWIRNVILDSAAFMVGRAVQWASIKTKLELSNCPLKPEGLQDSRTC